MSLRWSIDDRSYKNSYARREHKHLPIIGINAVVYSLSVSDFKDSESHDDDSDTINYCQTV